MTLDLYYMPESAPCRSVLLLARSLGVKLNLKYIDLMKGEQLKPEFVKINPQHVVPTLVDDGLVLWESRAILGYLVQQYAKDDSLYPKDPKKRALVDSRLYFDIGTLFSRFGAYFFPMVMQGAPHDSEKLSKVEEALKWLDQFLEGQTWVAGSDITIADYAIVASVTTIQILILPDLFEKFQNVTRWLDRAKNAMPGYNELNEVPSSSLKKLVNEKIAETKSS